MILHFVNGYTIKAKHVYKAAEEHENSKTHQQAISATLQCAMSKDIGSLIDRNLTFKRLKEIEQRRLVLKRLIDIIIVIGRQGLQFRGKEESAHSLNKKGNHGNFLELVLLFADYDSVLRVHLNQCILKSDKNKQNRGRGSLITFMSKSIVNKLIIIIGNSLQNIILNEIKESSIISVMVDSTQDVAVMDQLAIVVRYIIEGNIFERLLKLVVVKDSSGCSFDGAANMKGTYNGLKAHISKNNPDLIYTHCMAHVLNLVITDSSENCLITKNLYGLVEETAVFLSNSHKRMNIWKEQTVKMSISERFVPNKELLMDIAWLGPSKYKEIVNLSFEQLPSNSLNKLSKLAGVDRKTLFVELKQFAEQYSNFSATTRSVYYEHNLRETIDTEDDVADLFNTLYLTMKYVLILPCTLVSCKRAFSKLKILKIKLRSSINQEHLEPLMSLFVEEDLIKFIKKDEIIDQLASSSQELKRLLF
ncbi:hypothetical protein QTP88_009743 [Uroleucon formosanum]